MIYVICMLVLADLFSVVAAAGLLTLVVHLKG